MPFAVERGEIRAGLQSLAPRALRQDGYPTSDWEDSMTIKRLWLQVTVAVAVAGSATFAGVRLTHTGSALAKAPARVPKAVSLECGQLQGQTGTVIISPLFASASDPGGTIDISSFQWGVGRGI